MGITKLEHLTRTNHEDTCVIVNRLVDVINAMNERLHVVETELAKRMDDPRQAHKQDDRQVKPV